MARFTYSVVLVPEGEGYVVHVPALPGCVTQGQTVEEALAMAEEVIGLWLHGDAPQPESDGLKVLTATVGVDVEVIDGLVRTPGVIEGAELSTVGG